MTASEITTQTEHWAMMFEMKQKDWLEACKEIDTLEKRNERLSEALKFVMEYEHSDGPLIECAFKALEEVKE